MKTLTNISNSAVMNTKKKKKNLRNEKRTTLYNAITDLPYGAEEWLTEE